MMTVAELTRTKDRNQNNQSLTVLHVEDDEMISGIVKEILESVGWSVETCSDDAVAVENICGNAHYDLLLVDYDLPGLNGVELVRRTRRMDHRALMPIIVLSAIPVEAHAREAGADVCLQNHYTYRRYSNQFASVRAKCEHSPTGRDL
jgi:DNA-binding response OmpR family regulator